MASVYDLKPAFQRLLRPVLNWLVAIGATPNQLTWLAFIISVAAGVMLLLNAWLPSGRLDWVLLVLPAVLLVRMALNALDGMLAREEHMSTPLGEILNELGDVLSDVALYLPLLFYAVPGKGAYLIILFVILAVVTEFCGLLAKTMIGERRYDGPMGKSDRALVVGVYALLLAFTPGTMLQFSVYIFGIVDALLMLTCYRRLKPCVSSKAS